MKNIFEKKLIAGSVIITIDNGSAVSTINGMSTGVSSGMVTWFPKAIDKSGLLVAGICKVALTREEAVKITDLLNLRDWMGKPVERDAVYERELEDKRRSRFIASDGGVC